MPRSDSRRRLQAAVFVDTVGSTRIAAELGDRRWQTLLGRELTLLRQLLKQGAGREVDVAGDGLFAVFDEPAPAVRFAARAVEAVRAIGLEIRAGIHFGECEFVDGHPGGIVVHTGARTMTFAGNGEVVVTQTVRDLVSGGGLHFAESGTHELKGVPGAWTLFTLIEVDGHPVPPPLDEAEASPRREAFSIREPTVRRRTLVAAVAAVAIISSLTTAFLLDDDPASPPVARDRILSLDPATNSVRALPLVLPDTESDYPGLVVGEGGVWASDISLHHIDPVTGTEASFGELGRYVSPAVTTAFEDVWVASSRGLQRWDAADDEFLHEYAIPGRAQFGATGICQGFGSIWVTAFDGFVYRFDPDGEIPEKIRIGGLPQDVVATRGLIWVADEFGKVVLRIDPDTNEVGDDEIEIGAEPVSMAATRDSLWLVDPHGILTVVDLASGNSESIPLAGAKPVEVVAGLGAVWVADLGGQRILKIDELLREVSDSFSVPGAPAALAIDEETGLIWIRTIDSRVGRG